MFLIRQAQLCRQIVYYVYLFIIITPPIYFNTHFYKTFTQCEAQQVLLAQPAIRTPHYDTDGFTVIKRPPRQANNQVILSTTNSSSFESGASVSSREGGWKVTENEPISIPPDGVCDNMIVPLCNGVGWNKTVKPFRNYFNHTTQDQANEELNKFGGLFNMKDVNLYLCSLFAPQCTVMAPKILKPCRHLCTSVRNQLEQYLTTYYNNVSVLDPWNCHEYPTPQEDETCVGDHNKSHEVISNNYHGSHSLGEPLPSGKDVIDELAKCSDTQFDCKHKNASKPLCIENKYQCDGVVDCQETNQDELNCPEKPNSQVRCDLGHICDGRCLPQYQFCNGIVDCLDGSDEGVCPDFPLKEEGGFDYIKIVMISVSILTFIGVVIIRSCRKGSESKKSSAGVGMNGGSAANYEARNTENIIISHANLVQQLPPTPTNIYQESTYGRWMPGTSTTASSTCGNNYYQRCPATSTHEDSDLGRGDATYMVPTLEIQTSEDEIILRAPPPSLEEYKAQPVDVDSLSYDVGYDNIDSLPQSSSFHLTSNYISP